MTRPGAVVLAVTLAVVAGFLTWRVVGDRDRRCYWAVTVGTHDMGYIEVPCDDSVRHVLDTVPRSAAP